MTIREWWRGWNRLKAMRRRLFTRCEWCGGPHRKRDPVCFSCRNWIDWTPVVTSRLGEGDIMHSDCMSVALASRTCLCADPMLSHGDYGKCFGCGRFRAWRKEPTPADFLLASLPHGSRIPESMKAEVERLWKQATEATETQQTEGSNG